MTSITVTVNGEPVTAEVVPRMQLAELLRDKLGLTGTHLGCEHGVCGACTVMVDGRPVRACINFAAACDGAAIDTVEGFAEDALMQRLRQAFHERHALQCGYCTPGMLITARDLAGRLEDGDEARIRRELSGNLCRCTGYMGIVAAIKDVIDARGPLENRQQEAPAAADRGAWRSFEPADVGFAAAPEAVAPTLEAPAAPEGWTSLSEVFEVAFPPPEVWRLFEDVERVAGCMPGAEITAIEGDRIEGVLRVKFGPMSASFAGKGRFTLDAARHSGRIEGAGADRASASRAQAVIAFALTPREAGARTQVAATVSFQLAGPLAQFSRSGLVRDFAGHMTAAFARNLAAELEGKPRAAGGPARELGALSVLVSVVWRRLKRLFGA